MKFFAPVVSVMNRLNFFYKFNLIAILLGIPILLMTFLLIHDMNQEIKVNKEQQNGAKYNHLLKDLLRDVQQHRGMTISYLSGNHSSKEKINEKQHDIEQRFHAIKQTNQVVAESLNNSAALQQLEGQWEEIEAAFDTVNLQEAMSSQSAFIEEIIDFITTNADSSNLFLSQTNDTFYMINDVTKTLPNLVEKLGQMRALGTNILSQEGMTEEQKIQFVSLSSSVQQALKELEHDTTAAFASNPSLETSFGKEAQNAITETTDFIEFVQAEVIEKPNPVIHPEKYYTIATNTVDAGFILYDKETGEFSKILEKQLSDLQWKRAIILSLIGFSALLTVYSSIGFYLAIRNTIIELKRVSKNVANGDLTELVSLNIKDEMKDVEDANNQMIHSLRQLIAQINSNAKHLALSSEELTVSAEQTGLATEQVAVTIQEIATGANRQMQSVEDISIKIDKLAMGIQQIAAGGEVMTTSVNESLKRAKDGERNIRQAMKQIDTIGDTFAVLSKTVHSLSKRNDDISQFVKVITDIANQTNLLALNAAIEAARAGENGKGFAVVAEEVRKLAEQSSESAKQITELIASIQEETKNTVLSMDFAMKEVTDGVEAVNFAGESFGKIGYSVEEIALQTEQISSAVRQMSITTEQVVHLMSLVLEVAEISAAGTQNVSSATEEQLASMEEVTASSTTLSKMADDLLIVVSQFKL